jgi:fumarylacetoacetase
MQDTLNDFISDGKNMAFGSKSNCRTFDANNTKLQNNAKDLDIIIFRMEDVEMQLPVLLVITLIFY